MQNGSGSMTKTFPALGCLPHPRGPSRPAGHLRSALHILLLLALVLLLPQSLLAAPLVWLQIESQPSRTEAIARAKEYARRLPDLGPVHVFASGARWHSLALGPLEEDAAWSLRRSLRRARLIPRDAFITEGRGLRRHVWPAGPLDGLDAQAIAKRAASGTPFPAASAPDENIADDEPVPARTEPAAAATSAAPVPEADRETPAEAKRRERRLDRETKRRIQEALAWSGHYRAAIDGAFGRGTRAAIARWQKDNGFAPTGYLTGRQMEKLLGDYQRFLDIAGMSTWEDEKAGLRIDLPLGLVTFDRYDPPFAHFAPRGESGVRIVLVSRPGKAAALSGLRDFFKAVDLMPANSEALIKKGTLVMRGTDGERQSRVFLRHFNGTLKGYLVSWPRRLDALMERAEPRMAASLVSTGKATLDPELTTELDPEGAASIAGLEIRKPARSGSGVFVDERGMVLTVPDLVADCARVTIDHDTAARVILPEGPGQPARLEPLTPLAPAAVARLAARAPRPGERVLIAGFSHGGLLGLPSVTDGKVVLPLVEEPAGGTTALMTLRAPLLEGDRGGPVIDRSGRVLGLVLGPALGGRHLPEGMSYAMGLVPGSATIPATVIAASSDIRSDGSARPSRAALEEMARNMTALVACWK